LSNKKSACVPALNFSAHSILSVSKSAAGVLLLALNLFTFYDWLCVSIHVIWLLLVSIHVIRLPFTLQWLLCFSEFNSGLGFMGMALAFGIGNEIFLSEILELGF